MQSYLMLTNRGRQKDKSKEDILKDLTSEFADVFGYLLVFADNEGVDLAQAVEEKWLSYVNEQDL